ncbi:CPBP family glutamic-type intramembrane protease [Mastigocoleus testarum]|uniref:Abortive phage infection protein n=1 Tax=Mastigocoleus testarum BC008 TaxID=371196 RepID=A0A0V7ZE58_9CYAN|nr:CPBP family glutamic-type intramembrane protease [Mastigocoleus testarum]KST62733.1 abortive phage infection protein [Mastigocoleus testarum BC008]
MPSHRKLYRRPRPLLIKFILLLIATVYFTFNTSQILLAQQVSNYSIHFQQVFNQPQFYPINQNQTQNISFDLYQPIDNWVGRLILPQKQEIKPGEDWVWMEIQQVPPQIKNDNLLGKVVRLEWKNTPELRSYIKTVKRDVKFTANTEASQKEGIVHPSRLNNRSQVGPLQSLAGFRPNDDVIVSFHNSELITSVDSFNQEKLNQEKLNQKNSKEDNTSFILKIDREPVLATGRFYGLVKILSSQVTSQPANKLDSVARNETLQEINTTCTQTHLCANEYFTVVHYNRISGKFDGQKETIRIPQQVIDTRDIPPSTAYQIEASTAGANGWYIYGARDKNGIFTVQALAPRSLFQLQPKRVILGEQAGLTYIKEKNWQIDRTDKGKVNTVLIDPNIKESKQAISQWQVGDKAIVLNLFGGIGGKKAEELGVPKTITGHFAFGVAQVVREPITQELQFDVTYGQVYAHNPDGIISAKHSWVNYMGNLTRGWMATRPVVDILIKFDPVTQNYNFDGVKLSPLQEFSQQLQIMMARYRVGDGTGSATVTPATSCVQDSAQALYAAIQVIKQKVSSSPDIQNWLANHLDDPQTERFNKLITLGQSLEKDLFPLGIIRADWESSIGNLAGIDNGKNQLKKPFRDPSIWAALTTWRTMMPRQAQDELATMFLQQGGKLWFLETNQVGGVNSDIQPLAATPLLGTIKIPFTNISPIPVILHRILAAIAIPSIQDWLIAGLMLIIYGAIALPLGFSSGFLQGEIWSAPLSQHCLATLQILFAPAFVEELIFRVLPLPHPTEIINWSQWVFLAALLLLLFIFYHPLNAKTFYKVGNPTFFQPIFLILAGLLGLTLTIAYGITGSLWIIVFIHWIVVLVWLQLFGGMKKLI